MVQFLNRLYTVRYVKYKFDCKKNILYTAVDNNENVKLTAFQRFFGLPSIVISTITDHLADFAVIRFYFEIGVQEYKRNGDGQILSWGIISLIIWFFSNCAQAMIQDKRLKDVQTEDTRLKMLVRKTTPATGTRFQITKGALPMFWINKKTVYYMYNHAVSFIFGPILNVVNLYRTKPNKRLVSYRGVINDKLSDNFNILTLFFHVSGSLQTSNPGANENIVDNSRSNSAVPIAFVCALRCFGFC